jgi:hypothetical protein
VPLKSTVTTEPTEIPPPRFVNAKATVSIGGPRRQAAADPSRLGSSAARFFREIG